MPVWTGWVEFVLSIVSVSVLAIIGTVYALYRWYFGPKFRVGVPPTSTERTVKGIPLNKIGRSSITAQFRHKSDCLARPIREKTRLSADDEEALYSDKLRCRLVYRKPDKSATLAVIVENYGRRTALHYTLGVSFLTPKIHITDVVTESMRVQNLYVNRVDLLNKMNKQLKAAPSEIVAVYDDYMILESQYGDMIYLNGSIDGWMYEMALFRIMVEEELSQFVIEYSIDWFDGQNSPVQKKAFFQGFKVLEEAPT